MTKIPSTSLTGIYALLMEEIKERQAAATKTLQRGHHEDPPYSYLDIEFCYLQVRRMSEALALAVLIAHNDIDNFRSNKLMKEWNADALFGELSRLNASAFPRAARIVPDQEPGAYSALIANDGFLTKEKLARIYHGCAHGLHAGSLKRLLEHGRKTYNVQELIGWMNEIVRLLSVHVVLLPSGRMMTVEMAGGVDEAVICHLDEIENQASS